jgi:hypothetical protein
LIEQESRCCSFLSFEVKREAGELRWTARAGSEYAELLNTWAELPSLARSAEGISLAIERLGLASLSVARTP